MIRFFCKSCDKPLKAEDSIAGRKTKCSGCGNINRIPDRSTRKSGEKRKVDQDIISVLMETVPAEAPRSSERQAIISGKSFVQALSEDEQKNDGPFPIGSRRTTEVSPAAETAAPDFIPVFRRYERLPKKKSPIMVAGIAVALLTLIATALALTGKVNFLLHSLSQ